MYLGKSTSHIQIENSTTNTQLQQNSSDAENKADVEELADSPDTSSSTSPRPSEHEDADTDDRTIVSFEENDKSNPYNWPRWKKLYVVVTGMIMVLNSTMGE